MAAHLAEQYAPKNSWDAAQATQALAEIRRIREGGATVIFGHDDAQWQSVRKGAAFYS